MHDDDADGYNDHDDVFLHNTNPNEDDEDRDMRLTVLIENTLLKYVCSTTYRD